MATKRNIIKSFTFTKGKDLRTSDLSADQDTAQEFSNARITKSLSIVNRPGNKIVSPTGPYLGLWTHSYPDPTTGAATEIMLGMDQNLYKRIDRALTFAYVITHTVAYVSLLLDPVTLQYTFTIVDGPDTVLSFNLGTGLEASPVTITQLQTAVNAVFAWSMTFTGSGSTPAAFLPLTYALDCSSSIGVLTWNEWSQVNSTVANPFSNSYSHRGDDNYEHPSFRNLNGVTYIATGFEYVQKYDGQNVYRQGLPKPIKPTITVTATAGNPNGNYSWIQTYQQIDNRGNSLESTASDITDPLTAVASFKVNLTTANILAGSGFNTNGALINGNQSGAGTQTGLTVTNTPHTLKVGDTATFLDAVSGGIVRRVITATTATTISWASTTAVNVSTGAPISNGLTILTYRNKTAGVIFYNVTETVNNSFAATQTVVDNVADASLAFEYDIPIKQPDLLNVKPKYLAIHQGLLVAAGDIDNPDTVYYSDILNPEAFPAASNAFDIPATIQGGVTGMGSDQEHLIIGKDYALYYTSGTLNDESYRLDKISEGNIGIACHATVIDMTIQTQLTTLAAASIKIGILFLSHFGFKLIIGGSHIEDIGAPINPLFSEPTYNSGQNLQLKRAIAVNYEKEQLYLCYIPAENGSGTSKYANENSTVQIYDYFHNAWIDDTGINAAGGLTVYANNLWWLSKRSDSALTVTGNLYKNHDTNTLYDFADHISGIPFKIGSAWQTTGEPDVDKLWLRATVYNLVRDLLAANYTIQFQTEKDFQVDLPDTLTTLTFSGTSSSGWGYFGWGGSVWGGAGSTLKATTKLKSGKAKAMRFVMSSSTPHQKIGITGWSYEVVSSYQKEMRR